MNKPWHSEECKEWRRRANLAYAKALAHYPRFCRHCGGTGESHITYSAYDPESAYGNPCAFCAEDLTCPVCGADLTGRSDEWTDEWYAGQVPCPECSVTLLTAATNSPVAVFDYDYCECWYDSRNPNYIDYEKYSRDVYYEPSREDLH